MSYAISQTRKAPISLPPFPRHEAASASRQIHRTRQSSPLMTAQELGVALEARGCEVKEVKRLDTPSTLPPPESFMDALDPIYSVFPPYRLLDETVRGKLRVLLAREARRWVEEDVPAGRTAKVHLAIARRFGFCF